MSTNRKSSNRLIVMINDRQKLMLDEIKKVRGLDSYVSVIRMMIADTHEAMYGRPKDNRERSVVHETEKPVKLTKEEKAEQDRKDEEAKLTQICEDELKGVGIRDDEGNLIGCHAFQYEGRKRYAQRLNINEIESFGEIQYLPSKETFKKKVEQYNANGVTLEYDPNETMAQSMGLDK